MFDSATTLPVLVGYQPSFAMGSFGPCSFNIPHTHPSAAELGFVVEGKLLSQIVSPDKRHVTANVLEQSSITVFPEGTMHTEFNPTCYTTTMVSAFTSTDSESQQPSQTVSATPDDFLGTELGNPIDGADVAKFQDMIPMSIVTGVMACLDRCGIPMK